MSIGLYGKVLKLAENAHKFFKEGQMETYHILQMRHGVTINRWCAEKNISPTKYGMAYETRLTSLESKAQSEMVI